MAATTAAARAAEERELGSGRGSCKWGGGEGKRKGDCSVDFLIRTPSPGRPLVAVTTFLRYDGVGVAARYFNYDSRSGFQGAGRAPLGPTS